MELGAFYGPLLKKFSDPLVLGYFIERLDQGHLCPNLEVPGQD
jgi:hypothetical protein